MDAHKISASTHPLFFVLTWAPYFSSVAPDSSATANGFDGSLINGLLAIPSFNDDVVNRVNKNILGLIIAAISLGGLPALIPAGYVVSYKQLGWRQ